jgi:hypothetical protein
MLHSVFRCPLNPSIIYAGLNKWRTFIAFLVSPRAASITGTEHVIDGGAVLTA